MHCRIFIGMLWLLLYGHSMHAQISLSTPLANHMVVQRDKPLCLLGTAAPEATVQALLQGNLYSASANAQGQWTICLAAIPATSNSFDLLIRSGKDSVRFTDLLAGDLWICIGQSNMEWPLKKDSLASRISSYPADPAFRWYNPLYAGKGIFGTPFPDSILQKLRSGRFYEGKWESAEPATMAEMSAVAFYFGRRLRQETGIPIGLIQLAIGGAPLETFISKEALQTDSFFRRKTEGNWLTNDAMPVWVRERGMQNLGKALDTSDARTFSHPFQPSYAFEHGLKSLTGLPIAGFICYQGESNAQETERVNEYGRLQERMVNSFRAQWKDPDLHYYFVQLSSIDSIHYKSQYWPEFRFQQFLSYKRMSKAGMAVSADHGARNDVHPRAKKEVGERLARWALRLYYGQPVQASGPEPVRATYKAGRVTVYFDPKGEALLTSGSVDGFSLDGKAVTNLKIEKHRIQIPWPEKPGILYYGWSPYTTAGLQNQSGLPCTTFRMKID